MSEAGHHDESRRMLERLLDARPKDPDLYLLLATSLRATDRYADARRAVDRAIQYGRDDPSILTRAASSCFFAGDLKTARYCVDRAKGLKGRGFLFKSELRELDRNLTRREKGFEAGKRLSRACDAGPDDRRIAVDFARHLMRTGRTFTAYHIVLRGLLYHPEDRRLRRIEKKLRDDIPDAVRAEAMEWAKSGKSSVVPIRNVVSESVPDSPGTQTAPWT
jgi:Flp pilus assembly protein TadD